MKVVIRNESVNLTIPVPMFLLSGGLRLTKFIQKNMKKSNMNDKDVERANEILEALDMEIVAYALKQLKAYKGLVLLEVKGQEGDYILIKI